MSCLGVHAKENNDVPKIFPNLQGLMVNHVLLKIKVKNYNRKFANEGGT